MVINSMPLGQPNLQLLRSEGRLFQAMWIQVNANVVTVEQPSQQENGVETEKSLMDICVTSAE